MTVSAAAKRDLTAKVISDGQVAENGKVNYTYKKKTFLCFSSKISGVPTEPGTYTQTAKARGRLLLRQHQPRRYQVTADPQPAAEQPAVQAAEQPCSISAYESGKFPQQPLRDIFSREGTLLFSIKRFTLLLQIAAQYAIIKIK